MLKLGVLLFLAILPTGYAQSTAPSSYQPLTGAERWRRYWRDTLLSPGLYFAASGAAVGSQLGNDPPEWRQGAEGYAKRSASLLGLFALQETIQQGGAAALGYDPRYLRCQCKGFFPRAGHSIKGSFFTRNNAGRARLDLPMLAGAYGSGMLSMYWYPARYQPLTDGVRIGHQQVGFVLGVNLIREFGPELKHIFTLGRY